MAYTSKTDGRLEEVCDCRFDVLVYGFEDSQYCHSFTMALRLVLLRNVSIFDFFCIAGFYFEKKSYICTLLNN
jgi:hypothetical protein